MTLRYPKTHIKSPVNKFALLSDLPPEFEISNSSKISKKSVSKLSGVPPVSQIVWGKGFLNGMSWADANEM